MTVTIDTICIFTIMAALYLAMGLFAFVILEDVVWGITENPLWKPFIFLFWPVTLIVVLIFTVCTGFSNWIRDVKNYYLVRKQKKEKKDELRKNVERS